MEWGGEHGVIVFNHGTPRQRLMGWLLRDSQIPTEITDTLEQTLTLARTRTYPVLVVNSTSRHAELAAIVEAVRETDPEMRIIVLHDGRHDEGDEIPADICIHDVSDPDRLVETVRAALADGVPGEEEPHAAAEELV